MERIPNLKKILFRMKRNPNIVHKEEYGAEYLYLHIFSGEKEKL